MLKELDFPAGDIARICYMVGHHHTYTGIDGRDLQILLSGFRSKPVRGRRFNGRSPERLRKDIPHWKAERALLQIRFSAFREEEA